MKIRLETKALSVEIMHRAIIEHIDIQLQQGECLALVGPSGGGKTTLLRALSGLIESKSKHFINKAKRPAFLFQEPRLLPWRTAYQNIALIAPEKKAQIPILLEKLKLKQEDAEKYPHELSGGMRQRIALARALITAPDLLYMDEPFSALDHQLRRELQQYIQQEITKGMSVILVSHDRDEAALLAHKIHKLNHEKPATIQESHTINTPYSARDENWLRAQLKHPFFANNDIKAS